MTRKASKKSKTTDGRITRIRDQILTVDLLCPGSLVTRYNTCGKTGCRCAQDPEARHGPYYIWSRREEGRLVQTVVSASEAKILERAIGNHRRVLDLLASWGRESAKLILVGKGPKR
jgi:hypothetical protein